MAPLPGQVAQAQAELRELTAQVETLWKTCAEHFRKNAESTAAHQNELEKWLNEYQKISHDQFLEAVRKFQEGVRGVDQGRVDRLEARIAQLEQSLQRSGDTAGVENPPQVEAGTWSRSHSGGGHVASGVGQMAHAILGPRSGQEPSPPGAPPAPPVVLASAAPAGEPPRFAPPPKGEPPHSVPVPWLQPSQGEPPQVIPVPSSGVRPQGGEGVRLARPPPVATSPPRESMYTLSLPGTDIRMGPSSEMGDMERSSVVGVRAIGAKVPHVVQPLLSEILKNQPKKVFSGNPVEFSAWKKSWDVFAETLKASAGGV